MGRSRALAAGFLDALPSSDRERWRELATLEQVLVELVTAAETAWPDLGEPPERFVACLARKIPDGATTVDDLRGMRAVDLYICSACAAGNGRAIAALEAAFFPLLERHLLKTGISPTRCDEAKQLLRLHLFVAKEDRPPKIAEYSGRGDLRSWLRVVASRTAIDLIRKEGPARPVDDAAILDGAGQTASPELQHMKQLYKAEFQAAFREALARLSDRERLLLRQHFLDGLTVDALGSLYRVHRATAARWVVKAQESLLGHTRELVMKRLGVSSDECDSVLRLAQSQLNLTLSLLFDQK